MNTAQKDNHEMEELSEFERLLAEHESFSPATLRRGEIRNAIILEIKEREIIVDLNAKQDGIVRAEDLERLDETFRRGLKVGDEVPVYIINPRDADDNLVVSINMGLQRYDWEKARQLMTGEEVDTVRVTGSNRGGLLVRWRRLEGFIPSSHLTSISFSADRAVNPYEVMGKELIVKVIEVEQDRRRLIFSEREAQKEWRAQQKARLLAELKEADVVRGTVTGLRDFGAFVNLGGADGLIHVSELAWHRVDHPRDILKVGEEIDVYVLTLDRTTNRIALSRKRLLPDPWEAAQARYHEGQLVEGTVTNVVDFGAFVALDNGLEGLLHLSEMGDGSLKEPHSYVKKGDRLSLRVSHLEPEKRRVGFTQRWGTTEGEGPGEGDMPRLEGRESSRPPRPPRQPRPAPEAVAEAAADTPVDGQLPAEGNPADEMSQAPADVPTAPEAEQPVAVPEVAAEETVAEEVVSAPADDNSL
ncbi:MAG: S1 RNA-binding domain-containing protein [Armatimonadetes bacterium]|nr:S1 RNA-binding domain-containing protein [Anaerolineae bacterium]